jgi:hypothetical protein
MEASLIKHNGRPEDLETKMDVLFSLSSWIAWPCALSGIGGGQEKLKE